MKSRFVLLAALQLLTGLSTFGLHGLLGRKIGPEEYAVFGVFWFSTLLVSQVLFIAVQYSVTKYVSDYRIHGKRPLDVVRTLAMVVVVVVAIFIPVALAASPLLNSLFSGKQDALIAFVLAVSFYGASYIARGTVVGLSLFRMIGVILALEATVRLLVAVVGVYALDQGLTAMMLSVAAGSATSLFLLPVILKKSWNDLKTGRSESLPVRHALYIAIPTFVVTGSEQIILNSPTLLVKTLGDPSLRSLLGVFSAALVFTRVPQYLLAPITSTLLTDFTSSAAKQDRAHFQQQLVLVGVAFIALAFVMAIGFWLFGPFAFHIMYGTGFNIPSTQLAILGAGIGIFVLADVLNIAMVARGSAPTSAACWIAGVVGYLLSILILGTDSLYSFEFGVLVGVLTAAAALWLTHLRLIRADRQRASFAPGIQ